MAVESRGFEACRKNKLGARSGQVQGMKSWAIQRCPLKKVDTLPLSGSERKVCCPDGYVQVRSVAPQETRHEDAVGSEAASASVNFFSNASVASTSCPDPESSIDFTP